MSGLNTSKLIEKMDEVEKKFNDLQQTINEATIEQYRLQGEHRAIKQLLEDDGTFVKTPGEVFGESEVKEDV